MEGYPGEGAWFLEEGDSLLLYPNESTSELGKDNIAPKDHCSIEHNIKQFNWQMNCTHQRQRPLGFRKLLEDFWMKKDLLWNPLQISMSKH